jgi:hypothetical protein
MFYCTNATVGIGLKIEGLIYEEELFKKNISCHLRTLEHHFSCPVRHKINNTVKHIKITPIIVFSYLH